MTVKVTLLTAEGRKLVQDFAGCTDTDDGKRKCMRIFPGCKIKSAEEVQEKKK